MKHKSLQYKSNANLITKLISQIANEPVHGKNRILLNGVRAFVYGWKTHTDTKELEIETLHNYDGMVYFIDASYMYDNVRITQDKFNPSGKSYVVSIKPSGLHYAFKQYWLNGICPRYWYMGNAFNKKYGNGQEMVMDIKSQQDDGSLYVVIEPLKRVVNYIKSNKFSTSGMAFRSQHLLSDATYYREEIAPFNPHMDFKVGNVLLREINQLISGGSDPEIIAELLKVTKMVTGLEVANNNQAKLQAIEEWKHKIKADMPPPPVELMRQKIKELTDILNTL